MKSTRLSAVRGRLPGHRLAQQKNGCSSAAYAAFFSSTLAPLERPFRSLLERPPARVRQASRSPNRGRRPSWHPSSSPTWILCEVGARPRIRPASVAIRRICHHRAVVAVEPLSSRRRTRGHTAVTLESSSRGKGPEITRLTKPSWSKTNDPRPALICARISSGTSTSAVA